MRARTGTTAQYSGISRFFRSPETGKLVVVQMPNIPLWVFLAATATRLLFHPAGTLGMVVLAVGTGSLVVWTVLEIVRGESPFRRVLGAVVVIGVVVGWVARH